MTTRLYVSNLPYSIGEKELSQLFEPFGSIRSVRIIYDRFSGKSQGYGFVQMESAESALKAQSELADFELEGRKLNVAPARNSGVRKPPTRKQEKIEDSSAEALEAALNRHDRFRELGGRQVISNSSESET